jgi:hypothetical protein
MDPRHWQKGTVLTALAIVDNHTFARQDLEDILKSLDAANDLAQKLKRRSEQMLDILSTEISHLHADPDDPRILKSSDKLSF